MNFIRTLFIILVIYYGFKLVTRYLLPLLMEKTIKNMQSRMQEQIRDQQRAGRRDGEVTIERNPQQPKTNFSDKGEYVDFEEVE
ncbi:MAG TPA: DUF4834 family protein [Prolixibacteraceae bacterium]|nr:DUF4834 family protein [Prolixibacteraceae bacterium]